jgi:hypothetical protein
MLPKHGRGLSATSNPPFCINDWWQQQLGELEIRQVERCTLFLLILAKETSATVPDQPVCLNLRGSDGSTSRRDPQQLASVSLCSAQEFQLTRL